MKLSIIRIRIINLLLSSIQSRSNIFMILGVSSNKVIHCICNTLSDSIRDSFSITVIQLLEEVILHLRSNHKGIRITLINGLKNLAGSSTDSIIQHGGGNGSSLHPMKNVIITIFIHILAYHSSHDISRYTIITNFFSYRLIHDLAHSFNQEGITHSISERSILIKNRITSIHILKNHSTFCR